MLRREQNELLTLTGSGTPMGEVFRRYWIPALLAEDRDDLRQVLLALRIVCGQPADRIPQLGGIEGVDQR